MIRVFRTISLAALWVLAAGTSPTTRSAPPWQPEDPARPMKAYVETILGTVVTDRSSCPMPRNTRMSCAVGRGTTTPTSFAAPRGAGRN